MSISMASGLPLTQEEKGLLLELIDSAEQEAIQGLDHADTRSFKEVLRHRLDVLDSIKKKLHQLQ